MCEGAGPGHRPLGLPGAPGSRPGRKPRGTPAPPRRLLTHGGPAWGGRAGRAGPRRSQPRSPPGPCGLARGRERSRAGRQRVPTWSASRVEGLGGTRSRQAFPAVVISTASSGWERERLLCSWSFLTRDVGNCYFLRAPRRKAALKGDHTSRVGIWFEEVTESFLCPHVECKSEMLGWDRPAGGGD